MPKSDFTIPTSRPSLKSQGIRKLRGAGIYKTNHRPNQSIAIKKCWADPEYRARRAEGLKKHWDERRRDPAKFSRVGIPNGYRKAEALEAWARAAVLADEAMRRLEGGGIVDKVPAPHSDEALAKAALHEAIKLALGPGNATDRLAAARLVLTYTKPLPPSAAETQSVLAANRDGERLLAALLGSQ